MKFHVKDYERTTVTDPWLWGYWARVRGHGKETCDNVPERKGWLEADSELREEQISRFLTACRWHFHGAPTR